MSESFRSHSSSLVLHVSLALRCNDAFDECPNARQPTLDIRNRQVEFFRQASERFDPMRWDLKWRGPVVSAAGTKNRLARFTHARVVGDEFLHEQQVDQIAEAFVALASPGRQVTPCSF
jgi:hypothetical protein